MTRLIEKAKISFGTHASLLGSLYCLWPGVPQKKERRNNNVAVVVDVFSLYFRYALFVVVFKTKRSYDWQILHPLHDFVTRWHLMFRNPSEG